MSESLIHLHKNHLNRRGVALLHLVAPAIFFITIMLFGYLLFSSKIQYVAKVEVKDSAVLGDTVQEIEK